ncbi:Succinate dehydrogenase iron-sulfur subunit [Nymphon striatum]|nr:Succinate dehydrogenase iron-sulfur subunit [Nymphon striatum]
MKLNLKIWRQQDAKSKGKMTDYSLGGVEGDMSFLEMLDILNEQLINKGEEPVVFDHDCREGICGSCSLMINGEPHGPDRMITTYLMVDRTSFDRIQQSGGYISVNTSGNTVDANAIPINKHAADEAMDAATCIGCGACVAACKNASAMLFTSAKVSQFALLPQGQVEATERVQNMVRQMDLEGFGNCTNTGACEIECPKGISLENIARLNREYYSANLKG